MIHTKDVVVNPITSRNPSSWRCGSNVVGLGFPQGVVPAEYLSVTDQIGELIELTDILHKMEFYCINNR